MENAKDTLLKLGVLVPDIMIPSQGVDLEKWAVVACDQYTSERDYWEDVDRFVGDSPSTLRIIFPEAYLEDPHPEQRISSINDHMRAYVASGIFSTWKETCFLVKRETSSGASRWGLIVALDLEKYDFSKESRTYIRATEGTILSRIPPRKQIRKDAPLELPHILVLISDQNKTIIEPFANMTDTLTQVYQTALMKNGGCATAWAISSDEHIAQLAEAFKTLENGLDPDNPLLFAMGDGNHSLATAKSCWEDIKRSAGPEKTANHPARFALVELENIFDAGLVFEPIHRVLFNIDRNMFLEELEHVCASYTFIPVDSMEEIMNALESSQEDQIFGYADDQGLAIVSLKQSSSTIAAGSLQQVIDALLAAGKHMQVDYIHGTDVTMKLGSKPGNIGLFLPAIDKATFFDTIIRDGALPRKTFSMGEAHEKRYYMEARAIQ